MEKFFYRVNSGDGILSLSARFNVPPLTIIKDNNLAREISEGDVLFIRKTAGRTYTAEPFDTLDEVAEKFNIPPDKLAEINGAEYLFYGLTIVIPE